MTFINIFEALVKITWRQKRRGKKFQAGKRMVHLFPNHHETFKRSEREGRKALEKVTDRVVAESLEVIFQKQVRVFHRGFKHENTDESTRPQAECFYRFRVFETPMKHEARVFEISSPTKEN